MTLTKTHIVEELFAKNIFTKTEPARIIETFFELIKVSEGGDYIVEGRYADALRTVELPEVCCRSAGQSGMMS